MVLGYGNSQYPSHGRPRWISGNMPAQTTAKIVMASAKRLMELRQLCLNSSRIAEISVPAWPMPIHHTKLMMAKPHATGCVTAQMPTPFRNSQVSATISMVASAPPTPNKANQPSGVVRRQHDARDLLGDRPEGLPRRNDAVLSGRGVDAFVVVFHFDCHPAPLTCYLAGSLAR